MFDLKLDAETLDSIASAAESGCDYWVVDMEKIGDDQGGYYAEHLANGGDLKLRVMEYKGLGDDEDDISRQYETYIGKGWFKLGAKEFENAVWEYVKRIYITEELYGCYLDDDTAEIIFQLAIFGDVIFG